MNIPVDGDRLQSDLEANAEFGDVDVDEGCGRTVRTGNSANKDARDYLVSRLEDADLDVYVDVVGNIVGRWDPGSVDSDVAPIAAGSHLDSVPEGGIFDGPLGVYATLETVRAMQDADVKPARPVDIVSFTEEEGGRFADGLLGSSVVVGERSVEDALTLTDEHGRTLKDALDEIGYRGEVAVDAADWNAWLELHIEQGKRLEDADVPAGVVTTITGISHCEVTITGEANHAGSTPMGKRTDAVAAASEFVLDVETVAKEIVAQESESAVGTVGSLNVRPNAANVVPGEVELGMDIRDVNHDAMDAIAARARESLDRLERERGVTTEFRRPFNLEPVPMNEQCRRAFHTAGEDAGLETMDLHSGAAHDTMHIANVTDAGLLFAPSRDGISHNPREWTDWEDCAQATRVLAGALADLAVNVNE